MYSVHIFKGVKLMDIIETSGFPRLDNAIRNDGADRDGDITANLKAVNFDEEWAKNRNREIEKEVDTLREQINIFDAYYSDEWEHIDVMEDRIKDLLEERDKNTFKYGLAGERFNQECERKALVKSASVNRMVTEGYPEFKTKTNLLADDNEGSLYDKLISSGIPMSVIEETPEVNDESRFRFITEEMFTLYSQKNADYGDAFTQSLDEDGLLVSKIRLKDKLNRFAKLIENDALVNDESMRDTLIDMANYAVMTMLWLDANE